MSDTKRKEMVPNRVKPTGHDFCIRMQQQQRKGLCPFDVMFTPMLIPVLIQMSIPKHIFRQLQFNPNLIPAIEFHLPIAFSFKSAN